MLSFFGLASVAQFQPELVELVLAIAEAEEHLNIITASAEQLVQLLGIGTGICDPIINRRRSFSAAPFFLP